MSNHAGSLSLYDPCAPVSHVTCVSPDGASVWDWCLMRS